MKKWLKNLSTPEKVMIGIMLMLLIGIVMRWQLIKTEGGESIRNRFTIESSVVGDSIK